MLAARPDSINVMIGIMLPDIATHEPRQREKCEKLRQDPSGLWCAVSENLDKSPELLCIFKPYWRTRRDETHARSFWAPDSYV